MNINKLKQTFFISLLSLTLAGCGFRPLYSNDHDPKLYAVEIAPINSIEGAEFFSYLSEIIPSSKNGDYLLKTKFSSKGAKITIQKNSDLVRQNLNFQIEYELINKKDGKLLTKGEFNQSASYSTGFSPFVNNQESDRALQNLYRQAAEEVRVRLVLFFSKDPSGGA